MTIIEDMINRLPDYAGNPHALIRDQFAVFDQYNDGTLDFVDPSNAAMLTIENTAIVGAGVMRQAEILNRKQFSKNAQSYDDLYLHMSDDDYLDRFAQPSSADFFLFLGKDELLNKLVLNPDTGIREIHIPRNTFVTVAGTVFSLQYPVKIRQLQHGALSVVYDVSQLSPLYTLETNEIVPEKFNFSPTDEYYRLKMKMHQFKLDSQSKTQTTLKEEYNYTIPYVDKFYYARVYYLKSGKWVEMITTHSQQVYDRTKPTAVLRVADDEGSGTGVMNVRIPLFYIQNIIGSVPIRIDTYTTKGDISMFLSDYDASQFEAQWYAADESEYDQYVAPMRSFTEKMFYSEQITIGGAEALTFEELRERVITNATGPRNAPTTLTQAQKSLERRGYDITQVVDNLTQRAFLASKPMPAPTNEKLITSASASIELLSVTMKDLAAMSTVIDNGSSITITPQTLYKNTKSVVSVVTDLERNSLLALTPEKLALNVSNAQYMYSPYYYVLDASGIEFAVRPYYMDAPVANSKSFLATNGSTLVDVSTGSYALERTNTGYKLTIATSSTDTWKALDDDKAFCQLAFVPIGETERAYMNGTLIGKSSDLERIYEFDLSTNFNITADNALQLLKFKMFDQTDRITGAALSGTFDIIYSTSAEMPFNWEPSSVDDVMGRAYLPLKVFGITHESLLIEFGKALKSLWARSRTVVTEATYQKYTADVLAFYTEDVLANPDHDFDENGDIRWLYTHRKGDPVLDADGKQMILFRKNDLVRDPVTNEPIKASERDQLRQIDFMLLDGVYYFATDSAATDYRNTVAETIVSWVTNDLDVISKQLLEQTRIYFYPKASTGENEVLISNSLLTTVNAAQSFTVDLDVPKSVKNNTTVRTSLESATIKAISSWLDSQLVSVSTLVDSLRTIYGDDVVSFRVSGLGGADNNYPVITITDDTRRCSIRKKLVAQADNTVMVKEAVTVNFNLYEMPTA